MTSLDLTDVLNRVTVDSKDNGKEFIVKDRVNAIKHILDQSNYELQAEGNLFLLYGKKPIKGREIVLISSHIDCVYKQCFCVEKGEYYHGTFDNSLTNASIIYNMINDQFDDNVYIAFTGDEERDSNGCKDLIGYLSQTSSCGIKFVIVTDVTNEGWDAKAEFSVENDLGIDLFTAYRIVSSLNPYRYTFVHDAEPDESWDYADLGIPCLTLCIPVKGNLHDEAGTWARKASLPIYIKVLAMLANGISLKRID